MTAVLAFDLGGTRLKAALVTDLVAADPTIEGSTGMTGPEAVDTIVSVGHQLSAGAPVAAVGLAVPGIVEAGHVVALPGKFPGLVGVDLAAHLRRAFGVPTAVMNDAVAAAVGEAAAGA